MTNPGLMKGLTMRSTMTGAAIAALLLATAASAQDRAALRTHVDKHSQAIISIEIVSDFKFSYGGQANEAERKYDGLATIISPEGLAVASLSRIDPSAAYSRMSGEDGESFSARLKSVKYILSDNTEIDATVVLRDPDLDLAFLKPLTTPTTALPAVDMTDAATGQLLDEAFVVARTGRISRRSVVGMTGEIQGVVKLPRLYYIPSSELVSAQTGTPVFNSDGKVLGLTAVYTAPGMAQERGEESAIAIIIPADQVMEVAAQAKDIAPEEISDAAAPTEAAPAAEAPAEEAPAAAE